MAEPGNETGTWFKAHRVGIRIAAGVAVLLIAVIALALNQRVAPVKAAAIGARLELAAGEVRVKQGNDSPTVGSGVPLAIGAELQTGKGARALVRLSDGSGLLLRGDTKVKLGDAGLELLSGEAWLDAPAGGRGSVVHKIGKATTVSAADAGLSMGIQGEDVTVYVARGLAIFTTPGGRVEVNAGEQAKSAGSGAPKVAAVAFWEDWTGGMGDQRALGSEGAGSGRIYGIDPLAARGAPARTLEISRQVVRAVIRDGLAETSVDQTFSNPGGNQVEGWYWFSVPDRATVTSFAVETDGVLIEGEVIERKEAAAQYGRAMATGHEPALLEWIDGRSYRARIFPVPASGSRRVVLRYMELLSARGGKLEYVYPMRTVDAPPIGELSLEVDLGDEGVGAPIATLADAVVEDGGRRVTMRRSGYEPRTDFQVEVGVKAKAKPFRVSRFSADGDRADYVMARYVPDIDWAAVKELPGDVVVVVDTSASADETARQIKAAAAEATLRALSLEDRFALVALDATAQVLYPKEGLAPASEKEISTALERLADHGTGGATDLGALFDVALGRLHPSEQPAVVYIGDGLATSGEVSGDRLSERLRRSLSASRARFFTVAVGADANHALLRELARAGGGQAFRIDQSDGATAEVLRLASAIKTPTITDLDIDLGAGLDEPMITASGKLSRGEEVIVLARTHHALPTTAKIKGRLAGAEITKEYAIELDRGIGAALVPRLWAAEKMRRLMGEASDPEEHRGKVVELGVEYGLMTPFTSILALESEQAYQQQGIQRRSSPLRGVRLTSLDPRTERALIDAMTPLPPRVAFGCSRSDAPAASDAEERPRAASVAAQPARNEPARAPMGQMGGDEAPTPPPPPAATMAPAAAVPREQKPGMRVAYNNSAGGGGGDDAPQGKQGGMASFDVARTSEKNRPQANAVAPAPSAIAKPGPAKALPSAAPVVAGLFGGKGGGAAGLDKTKELLKTGPGAAAPPRSRRAMVLPATCSDAARRPLAERIVLWSKRVRSAGAVEDLLQRYEGAKASCEIGDWRAEAALLSLLQAKVRTPGAATTLLSYFADQPETQRFVAHVLLRRTVDPRITAEVRAVLFGERVSWRAADEQLAALATPDERLAKLRELVAAAPGDPEGEVRLVRALAQANQRDEALNLGRRLRDRGLMSPALAVELGDVLVQQNSAEEALRTYSEIVEFDAGSADSRRLLGDVCLRNGWYAPAYRQYKTLTDLSPSDASGWLRLAAAAAGSGRVDEALRLQRQVASAEGTPGPNDPRAWARLWSAARLARLLGEAQKPDAAAQAEGVARKLKELQVFAGPATFQILTWEDMAASLLLVGLEGEKESPIGEVSDAADVGLTARLVPTAEGDKLRWAVRWRKDPPGRAVRFVLHTLVWDGKGFRVTLRPGELAPAKTEAAL